MHIFLDESGNLGFDFTKSGTSRYFVITVLVSNNFDPISLAINRTMKAKFRQKKKTRQIDELKGTHTTFAIKNYFYQQMLRYEGWYLHSIILDKTTLLHQKNLRGNTHQLYNLLAENLLRGVIIPKDEKIIQLHIDRSKEQNEIEIFDRFVRSGLASNLSKDCTLNIDHLRSQDDYGLQAVDLFCYGIARKHELNDMGWYNIFKDKIKQELIFRA